MVRFLRAMTAGVFFLCTGPASGFEIQSAPDVARDTAMDAVDKLMAQGNVLFSGRRYEEALGSLSAALSLSRRELGDGPYTAMVLTTLGLNYASTGRLAEAEAAYEEASAIEDNIYDADSFERLPLFINRGQLYANTARPAQALPFLQKAHALCLARCAPDDQRLAYLRNSLAAVYRELGLNPQAGALTSSPKQ